MNDSVSVTGTLTGYTNNLSSSCANAGQPDRFYLLTLAASADVEFTIVSSGFQPALSLHPYGSGSCGSELGCLQAAGIGAERLRLKPPLDVIGSGSDADARRVEITPGA